MAFLELFIDSYENYVLCINTTEKSSEKLEKKVCFPDYFPQFLCKVLLINYFSNNQLLLLIPQPLVLLTPKVLKRQYFLFPQNAIFQI